ncbi:MAG: DUF2490 domain-containing protein, partial [Bacteroidales bacterium]|nr:DUF2490 domain-containing protein [Bacteroidales bacterium]
VDLQGQVKDFQSWWELELNKEISSKLDLNGELEQRFKNNSLQYSRTLLTLGASYEFLDYLRLAGGARTVFVMDGEQQLHTRYRLHLDGMGSYDLSGFDLSLRIRLQYGFDEVLALRYLSMNTLVNRNRLKVAQHIFGTRFGWFASAESWHGSNNESRWLTYAMRYTAGARFTPNFTSRLSLRYILENEFNMVNPRQLHVVVLGYTYRF